MIYILQVLVNNEDYTQYANQKNLRIIRELKNYNAELDFLMPLSLFNKIQPSVDLKIYNGEKLLFGGLVYRVRYGRLVTNKGIQSRIIHVTIENYNILMNRRTISGINNLEPTDPNNPENDKNTAGRYFREIIMNYLAEEGVTQGEIGEGARLAEKLEQYEFDTMSLREIANVLAGLTGENFYIDIEKKLNFAMPEVLSDLHHYPEHRITESNHNFYNIEVEKTLEGYMNKVFIRGDYPYEDLGEELLDYDGRIKYVEQNDEEIARMQALNNDSGVWGKVINDDRIEYLDTAEKRAEIEMRKHGLMPVTVYATTKLDIFKPGDKVVTELLTWDISSATFTVKKVTIGFNSNNELEYRLELINNDLVDDSVFSDIISNQGSNINKNTQKIENVNDIVEELTREDVALPVLEDMTIWMDVQNNDSIVFSEGSKIKEVKDSLSQQGILSQVDSLHQPELVDSDGKKWIKFDHTKETRLNFLLNVDVGTAFVVFKDTSDPSLNSYGAPLGEHYQSSIYGEMFAGRSGVRSNLMVNGITVNIDTQQKIRNTKTLATLTTKPENLGQGETILLNLGQNNTSTSFINYYTGLIAEVVVYSTILSPEKIESVNNYLMNKYNIS